MDRCSDESGEEGSLNEDSILHASLVGELERVLGPLDGLGDDVQFQWLIPVTGIAEMLELLRDLPSGFGVTGFEQLLRDRFGSTSMLKLVNPESGEADV